MAETAEGYAGARRSMYAWSEGSRAIYALSNPDAQMIRPDAFAPRLA
jgi:hypothetical protein